MKTNKLISRVATLSFALLLFSAAYSAQFSVQLVKQNGPTIVGVVDTATDELRINSWVDPSPTPANRVPALSQLPLTLRAFGATGSLFDVPDSWDGQVGAGAGFCFLLPLGQDLTTVLWTQGQLSSWQGASFGWGGLRNSLGGVVLRSPLEFCYVPDLSGNSVRDLLIGQVTVTALPIITIRGIGVSQVQLCWQTATNTWYQLQSCSTLSTNGWLPLSTDWVAGYGTSYCATDEVGLESSQKFYRLAVRNSPP